MSRRTRGGRIDGRTWVAYLVAATVAAFGVSDLRLLLGLAVGQLLLDAALSRRPLRTLRRLSKLSVFFAVLALSYALSSVDPERDQWVAVGVGSWRANLWGLQESGRMALRVVIVVMASQLVRNVDPQGLTRGLRSLRVPEAVTVTLDTTLALLADAKAPSSGRRNRRRGKGIKSFLRAFDSLGRGQLDELAAMPVRQIRRAQDYLRAQQGDEIPPGQVPSRNQSVRHDQAVRACTHGASRARTGDVPVVVGLSVSMLGVKALKLLPAVPFAPGHKLVLLNPLYLLASRYTQGALGATYTGASMGAVAFVMGDGKYGIFEVLKHIAPGLVSDAARAWVPARLQSGRRFAFAVSLLMAVARFATIFSVMLVVQAPSLAYAVLIPGLAVHGSFGVLAGWVGYRLLGQFSGDFGENFDPTEKKMQQSNTTIG